MSETMQPNEKKFDLKILHMGFHRTGSMSVAKALEMLGFGPVWHAALLTRTNNKFASKGLQWWLKNDCEVYKKLDNNEFVDFNEWFNQIQCPSVMDAPTILYADKMFEQFPDCKVVCPIFEYKKWYPSMCSITSMICQSKIFYLSTLIFNETKMFRRDYMPRLLNNKIKEFLNKKDETFSKRYYNARLEYIKKIVPKEQLLVFDVRDGWNPLCKFLNVPVPKDVPFPNSNNRKSVQFDVKKLIVKDGMWRVCLRMVVFIVFVAAIVRFVRGKSDSN